METYNGFKVGDRVFVRQNTSGKLMYGGQLYEIEEVFDRFGCKLVYENKGGELVSGGVIDAGYLIRAPK
jgi:hypothetical protein